MNFQPVVPLGGYAGWRFLARTQGAQAEVFNASAQQARLADHVRKALPNALTPEALVADRRLLEVALGAYGLKDDVDARAFVRTLLSEGTLKPDALANRLSDKRYAAFAREFGYGDLGPRVMLPGFADRLLARFQAQEFQAAVGARNDDLRLALNVEGALKDLLAERSGTDAQWFALMGNPPLRQVFETALGLPRSFGRLDVDRQLAVFKDRAQAALGTASLAEIARPETRETLVRLFLLRSDAATGAPSPQATALALLRR